MNKIKIGVVEDEMVIADTISLTLRKLGYEVATIASNYIRAVKMIDEEKPDLVLLDINLGGQKDGIDVAHYVREKYPIPIIFLTANSDMTTVQRAKPVRPNAFLVKPFSKDDLYAAIEIAISNYHSNEKIITDSILVKDGYNYIKVFLREIMFVTSDQNYVTLHLNSNKRIMVRSTLAEMEDRLNSKYFLRINRGNIINISDVTKIETDKVYIGNIDFVVFKAQREELIKMME